MFQIEIYTVLLYDCILKHNTWTYMIEIIEQKNRLIEGKSTLLVEYDVLKLKAMMSIIFLKNDSD